jgi:uncharacterized glyoxalase superfamily protein PhnB
MNDSERDEFTALRLPETQTAESPNPQFARRLRAELQRVFDPNPKGPKMSTHTPNAQLRTVTPYLCVHDGRAAIDWYCEYFGAQLDGQPFSMDGSPFGPDSAVGHATLWFGNSVVYLSDEWPEGGVLSPRSRGGTASSFVLDVPTTADVDAVFDRAVANGATATRPVNDQHYGARAGQLTDPFGYSWSISSANTPSPTASNDAPSGDAIPTIQATRDATNAGAASGGSDRFAAEELWNEVGYYTIAVPDPAKARVFYSELFDWDLPEPENTPAGYYSMHNPSTKVPMGFVGDTGERNPRLYFRVRDLDAMCERVVALGGLIVQRDGYESGGGAECRDDQGYEFDLWQPAPGY